MRSANTKRGLIALAVITAMGLAGCGGDSPVEPQTSNLPVSGPPIRGVLFAGDGELLGRVFDGSVESTSDNLFFELSPLDSQTDSLLSGTTFKPVLWVDPNSFRPRIEYFYPSASSDCGGSLAAFFGGNAGAEVHRLGPGSGDPTGPEGHCIVPGRYRVTLRDGPATLKTYNIDYLQLEKDNSGNPRSPLEVQYPASPFGLPTGVEVPAFNVGNETWHDLWVNFHLNATQSHSDTTILDIENSGGNPASTSFANQTSPSGTTLDYFRYGVERSTSTWQSPSGSVIVQGRALSRIYWSGLDPTDASGFFDSHSISRYLRIHQYTEVSSAPSTVTVGLEIMRPDEDPASGPSTTRTVSITAVGPAATFNTEFAGVEDTWKLTDQVFDASGSSSGPDIRYSWKFENTGSFGPESTDPTIEFDGHSTSGPKTVIVKVRNVSNGLSNEFSRTIDVANNLVSVSGPIEVYSKKPPSVYESSQVGDWHERNINATTWNLSGTNTDVLTRIWAAGVYTAQLRSGKVVNQELRRRRINVDVCIAPGCVAFSVRPSYSIVGSAEESFGIFGAGPWISAAGAGDREVARFYDLTGLHERRSPFAEASWMDRPAGTARSGNGRWDVKWTKLHLDSLNAVGAVLKVVPGSRTAPYTFGMAVDLDLGRWPSDDVSGYDPALGLLHVRDGEEAMGILLLSGTGSAISQVRQYGVDPHAPRTADQAWEAQRSTGITLDGRPGDVQLLISAEQNSGIREWTFVVIRAGNLSELQTRANTVLLELGVAR